MKKVAVFGNAGFIRNQIYIVRRLLGPARLDVMGLVIERVTGKGFDVFLRERLFDPAMLQILTACR